MDVPQKVAEQMPWMMPYEARSEAGHLLLRSITATCSPFWVIVVPTGQN